MKKIISLVMAFVMMMAVMVPAFAAELTQDDMVDNKAQSEATVQTDISGVNGDGTYTVSYPATMALRWSDETTDFEIKITSQLKTGKCVSVVLADKENGLVMKNDAGSEIPYTLSQTAFATTAPVVTDDVHPFSVNVTADDWNAVSFDEYSDILTVTTSVADL